MPLTSTLDDLLYQCLGGAMGAAAGPRAAVLQPNQALGSIPGQPLVSRAYTHPASLGGLFWPKALLSDAADKKFSTKRRQTGIFMVVHPGS
ncbi:hypothetical protein ABW45_22080, partial [Stenotrophomonas maltophilia]